MWKVCFINNELKSTNVFNFADKNVSQLLAPWFNGFCKHH